jgi:hypothetical protein
LVWLDSIHFDIAPELAFASSGMMIALSRAIFSAYDVCAGLAGLVPPFVSGSFFGACWSRKARQIDPDFA